LAARDANSSSIATLSAFFCCAVRIRSLVLAVQSHQPDLMVGGEVVVDNPQSAAAAFAATRIRPSHLSEAARPWHQIAHLRSRAKAALELPVIILVQILGKMARKWRRFHKLHSGTIR
jgi:hypothetical protein